MRSATILAVALCIATGVAQAQKTAPKTDLEKLSYSIGADIGKNFKMQEIRLDVDMMARGIRDGLSDGGTVLSDEEMQSIVGAFQEKVMQQQQQRAMEQSSDNRKIGEEFLSDNKKKEGVVELPSGLQYQVLKKAEGPKPTATDEVTVHYRGTLISGKEFDSSFKRNEPATFRLSRVIKGWTEGVQLMSVGSKYRFFVPSELAYGDRQMGADILPGSTLIFEVELLNIQK